MIIELKTFEEMTPAEQRQHLLDILTDDGNNEVDLEELRKVFLKRVRHAKSERRAYLTCKELGDMVGRSATTIREMFRRDTFGVKKKLTSGPNRKSYMTMQISRAAAKRRFPDLNI